MHTVPCNPAKCPCLSLLLHQALINSSNPATSEAGLLILADLAGYSTDHLRPHLAHLHPLLANGLNAADMDVQVRGAVGDTRGVG
jgi:hypothetical protein